jgi:hypothetical protein
MRVNPARCAERLRTGEKTEVLSFGGRVALAGSTVRPTEALGRGRTTEKLDSSVTAWLEPPPVRTTGSAGNHVPPFALVELIGKKVQTACEIGI